MYKTLYVLSVWNYYLPFIFFQKILSWYWSHSSTCLFWAACLRAKDSSWFVPCHLLSPSANTISLALFPLASPVNLELPWVLKSLGILIKAGCGPRRMVHGRGSSWCTPTLKKSWDKLRMCVCEFIINYANYFNVRTKLHINSQYNGRQNNELL